MSPTTRVNITLDEHSLGLLSAIASLTGASRSEIIRRGVEAYKRELEDVFLKEAIDAELSKATEPIASGKVGGTTKADRRRVPPRKRS